MRIALRILCEIAGWLAALLVLGYVTGEVLPHFDPELAARGSGPSTLCYGTWIKLSATYAVSCRASWLAPIATWVNLSNVIVSYTLRFLLMAIGRDVSGDPLEVFDWTLFEALAVFAIPTLIVLIFGALFWGGIVLRLLRPRRSSVAG